MKRDGYLGLANGEGDPTNLADRLLDVNEAAAFFSVKPVTIRKWAYLRRLPVVKLMGRALRFRLSDLERLVREGFRPALRSPETLSGTGSR